MNNPAKNTPEQPALREGVDTPESIVRAELNPDIGTTVKALSEQAFTGNPEKQKNYAKEIQKQILDHAHNYFNGPDQYVIGRYWSFITQKTEARQIQIVHNRQEGKVTIAFLSENQTDITDSVLHRLYLSRKIEQPDETRNQLAELSRGIKAPPGQKLPPSPYEKDNPDNRAA